MSFDLRIYALHGVFWLAFALGDLGARYRNRTAPDTLGTPVKPDGQPPLEAPRAGLLVAVHMVAFALMYAGIGQAVFGGRVSASSGLPPLRVAGTLVILIGAVVVGWARLAFASWRFRARLDAGHQLATGGPFRLVRHPIYAGLDLLALGSALWAPMTLTILGAIAMVLGGELRARAEEPLLEHAFGDSYRDYRRRTKRFIPGVY